jgi:hypothetical protein
MGKELKAMVALKIGQDTMAWRIGAVELLSSHLLLLQHPLSSQAAHLSTAFS